MLPRRQNQSKRVQPQHIQPHGQVTMRQWLFIGLGLVCFFGMYMNIHFFMTFSTENRQMSGKKEAYSSVFNPLDPGASMYTNRRIPEKYSGGHYDPRQVKTIVFTSSCDKQDLVRAHVLAYTARAVGYEYEIVHLTYGCDATAISRTERLWKDMNPALKVAFYHFEVQPPMSNGKSTYTFGQPPLLTTTLNLPVVRMWWTTIGSLENTQANKDFLSDFILLIENDAIFTKKLEIGDLLEDVDDIEDPKWFGQDANWYIPGEFLLSKDERISIFDAAFSSASDRLTQKRKDAFIHTLSWRDFAATAPYVIQRSLLDEFLLPAGALWTALSVEHKYLAIPMAANIHDAPIGIAGILSVHHYPSRYENWDFVDDQIHNPCNQSIYADHGANITYNPFVRDDIALRTFPISIRPENFTLPAWIDGKLWGMTTRTYLPEELDYFANSICDLPLLTQPSGYLYYLATHTNGYERIPSILRRRHTSATCMAIDAYNHAILYQKQQNCPQGYNTEQLLKPLQLAESESAELTPSMQFIVVTSCTPKEQVQLFALQQSFINVNQAGDLTVILAGCSSVEYTEITKFDTSSHVHYHLVQNRWNYGRNENNALQHAKAIQDWVSHGNPRKADDSVVVLLHIAFIFAHNISLQPNLHRIASPDKVVTNNYGQDYEVVEGLRQLKPFFVYEGSKATMGISDIVKPGFPLAQKSHTAATYISFKSPINQNNELLEKCASCASAPQIVVQEHYLVTPPYFLHLKDLARLVDPQNEGNYVALTLISSNSSMGYAYAALNADLKHTMFTNFLLSDSDSDVDSYWKFVERLQPNPCDFERFNKPYDLILQSSPLPRDMPYFVNTTSNYMAYDDQEVSWTYSGSLLPEDLFKCDSWLLAEPPSSVWKVAKKKQREGDGNRPLKQAFGLCTSIRLLNDAIVTFKNKNCPNGYNYNKRLRLVSPAPSVLKLKVGGKVQPIFEIEAAKVDKEKGKNDQITGREDL